MRQARITFAVDATTPLAQGTFGANPPKFEGVCCKFLKWSARNQIGLSGLFSSKSDIASFRCVPTFCFSRQSSGCIAYVLASATGMTLLQPLAYYYEVIFKLLTEIIKNLIKQMTEEITQKVNNLLAVRTSNDMKRKYAARMAWISLFSEFITMPLRRVATIQQTCLYGNAIEIYRLGIAKDALESPLKVFKFVRGNSELSMKGKVLNFYVGSSILWPIFLSNYLSYKVTMASTKKLGD